MLLWFLEYLHSLQIKIPAVFFYSSTRMLMAALTSLLLTIFLGPHFIKKLYELKIGQSIRSLEEVPLLAKLHGKKQNTPTMGGILILFSMGISLFLWMDLQNLFTWILASSTLILGFLGATDDYLKLRYQNSKGLKGRFKMVVQLGFSFLLALYLLFSSTSLEEEKVVFQKNQEIQVKEAKVLSISDSMKRVYIPFFKEPLVFEGFFKLLLVLFIMCVVTGASNAVNLTDGLDGLASGCLVLVSTVLALFAFLSNHLELSRYLNILYIEGSSEIAIYLMALAGGALGFLWYNGYPAQVFMGDTGSLALGGILGVSSVLLRREFLLAIAGGIFVLEALSVILQVLSYRFRGKKRVFLCAPLHHHFEYKGWPETKVVLRFWILCLFFCMIALASLKFQ